MSLFVLFLLWCTSCGKDAPAQDSPDAALTEDEKSIRCDTARTAAADAYAALDRSCVQDSDCEALPVGGCGCPVPLHGSAQLDTFTQSKSAAREACDEYYVAPGAQACTGAVLCDFEALVGSEDTIVCNEQGVCDEPPMGDSGEM